MKTKRILAFLIALCGSGTMMLTPASAAAGLVKLEYEQIGKFLEGENGNINTLVAQGIYNAILVETDGTELTEEMVNALNGYSALLSWQEFRNSYVFYHGLEFDISSEENSYVILTESTSKEECLTFGRQLLLGQEFIENAEPLKYSTYEPGILIPTFYVRTVSSDITLDETSIPELAGTEISSTKIENLYECTITAVDSELYSIFWSETMTEYEKYVWLRDFGNKVQESHSDLLESVLIQGEHEEGSGSDSLGKYSCWQTAGDPNADGAVDAKDAASILQTAAENGTGAGIAATSATDVNADGEVNAKDAAAVLVYAAEEGAGKTPDWVEILRR